MNSPRRFIAWQPVLTDHQAYTYLALAKQAEAPLTAYVLRMEDEARRAQGWRDTQVTSIDRQLIPAKSTLRYCYRQLLVHRNDVHFFGSAFESPLLMLCLLIASCLRIEFYLITEPYSPKSFGYFGDQQKFKGKLKAYLRPLMYWLYARVLLRKVAGVFAISRLALEQYRRAGIPKSKLFPFGYFIPQMKSTLTLQSTGALRIVFVGALIQRKGLDILIEAVRHLQHAGRDITLHIYGPGDFSAIAVNDPGISYRGLIPFGQSQEQLAAYDLLALPSRYDGWGVVVNEAICAGVPVVCSDQVGASVLTRTYGAGTTFLSGKSQALAHVLAEIQDNKDVLQEMRRATATAAAAIQPEVAAGYMLRVIAAQAGDKASVPSPWYAFERADKSQTERMSVRVHLTNVVGAGAGQLLLSLLPAMESNRDTSLEALYLPDKGPLKGYLPASRNTRRVTYRRSLPNAISRILECTIFGRRFDGTSPLLVLGDMPVSCHTLQIVFVQTSHLVQASKSNSFLGYFKFLIARQIFTLNQKYVSAFIVQTEFMRDALLSSYPELQGRVHIVAQPVPNWLLEHKVQRCAPSITNNNGLRLFYPAAYYPHKNHQMLAKIFDSRVWPIESLELTLESSNNPAPEIEWVKCIGFLSTEQMRKAYEEVDALLFLSLTESYGFPLIEAMFIGLPIICPNLAYARTLCGTEAIYFEANDIESMRQACIELKSRLLRGWKPDWSEQINGLPKDWESVASQMFDVIKQARAYEAVGCSTH